MTPNRTQGKKTKLNRKKTERKKNNNKPKCELFVIVLGETVVERRPLVSGIVSIGCL